ncbi:MAG: hypothetical protein OHK0028_16360 [Deltaproteobacteria bacterium]
MKRAILFGAMFTTAVLLAVCLTGRGDATRKDLSSTRRVTIDGDSYLREESPLDEPSLLRREMEKRNVRQPEGFDLRDLQSPLHAVFSGQVVDSPRRFSDRAINLPAGLAGEHTIRMEGEGKPVDLVFGKMSVKGPSMRERLLASGWVSLRDFAAPNPLQALQKIVGKETTVVFLDETEGEFLLFREVER